MLELAVQGRFEQGEPGQDLGRIQPVADQPGAPSSQSRVLSRESIVATTATFGIADQRRASPVPIPAVTICHHARPEMKTVDAPSVVAMAKPEIPPTTKGWTADSLVELGPRMQHIPRVSAIKDNKRLTQIIKDYEASGIPLIIEGWNKTPLWPGNKLFGIDWVLEHGDEKISVRDCVSRRDKEIMFKEFIETSRTISEYAQEGEKERLYGKDAVCPKAWQEWLMESGIPEVLKPGCTEDVLELLPAPERVETLMCYYGIGDTFTAAHKDLCASSGQNLMCSAEREGSAFWFMARSSDAANAASYFQKLGAELDHETHVATPKEFADAPFTVYIAEQRVGDLVLVPRRSCHQVVNHGGLTMKMSWSRMTIEGLNTAFHHELPLYRRVCRPETYRVRLLVYRALAKYTQDLEKAQQELKAIIPAVTKPSYQARLRSKASSKTSQLFTSTPPSSPESLQSTLSSDPHDDRADTQVALTPEHERLIADVRSLLVVFDKILREEHHGDTQCEMRIPRTPSVQSLSSVPFTSNGPGVPPIPLSADTCRDGLTCDFCGADIFQSFFECRSCAGHDVQDDSVVVCPSCYVEGRACGCAIMTPVQQYPMDILLEAQNRAQKLLNFEGYRRKNHPNVVKVVALSHQAIDKLVEHPGIFSAACQLLRIRIAIARGLKKSSRSCRRAKVHNFPAAGTLDCKRCHCARCFKHILVDGYYVADALKLRLRDDTHAKWHSLHVRGAKRLAEVKHVAQKAEETGAPCNMSVSLVLHAEKYTSCRPMSDKVKPGWYDDASYLELDMQFETSDGENADPVLGESDDEEEIIEVSSRDSPPEPTPFYRKPTLFRRRSSDKTLATVQPRRPSTVPYILLPNLTSLQRERFFLKRLQIPTPISRLASVLRSKSVSPTEPLHLSIHSALASSFSQNSGVGPAFSHPLITAAKSQSPLSPVASSARIAVAVPPKPSSPFEHQASARPSRYTTARPKGIPVRRPKKVTGAPLDEAPIRGRRRGREVSSPEEDEALYKQVWAAPCPKVGPPSKRIHTEKAQETPLPKRPQPKPRRRYIPPKSPTGSVAPVERVEAMSQDNQRSGDVPVRSVTSPRSSGNDERDELADNELQSSGQTIVQDSALSDRKHASSLPRFKRIKNTETVPPSINTQSTLGPSTLHSRSPSPVTISRYPFADAPVIAPSSAFTSTNSTLLNFSPTDWPQMSANFSPPSKSPTPAPPSSVAPEGVVPSPPISQAACSSQHGLEEVYRRLERYERDVNETKEEKNELRTELKKLKDELEQAKVEPLEPRGVREELEKTRMEVLSLKVENAQLRQQLHPSSVVINGTTITANLHGGNWPQHNRTAPHGGEQFPNNNRRFVPPGPRGPYRRDNQAQGYDQNWKARNDSQISRVPPPPPAPPYRQNARNHAGPTRPANDYPLNKKRRWGNTDADELYSAPLQRNDIGNGRELARVIEDHGPGRMEHEERNREHRRSSAPGPDEEHDHERRRNMPHVSMNDFKRRKFGYEVVQKPPPRRGVEEEDPFLPDEFAFGENTRAAAPTLTPGGTFPPSTPVHPSFPPTSAFVRPADPAFRSAITTPRPGNELELEIDSHLFTASTAANNDVDLTGNPWEGSKSKNPLLDSV